eukprot:scaffold109565_cov63-Phaeocystis_antarctica.AAC.2
MGFAPRRTSSGAVRRVFSSRARPSLDKCFALFCQSAAIEDRLGPAPKAVFTMHSIRTQHTCHTLLGDDNATCDAPPLC